MFYAAGAQCVHTSTPPSHSIGSSRYYASGRLVSTVYHAALPSHTPLPVPLPSHEVKADGSPLHLTLHLPGLNHKEWVEQEQSDIVLGQH